MGHDSAILKAAVITRSPLAIMSPACKLAAGLIFAVCISFLSHHVIALLACAVSLLLTVTSRIPLLMLGKRLIPVNFFFIFLWFLLPLNFSSGSFSFSHSGLEHVALITLKGNAIAAMLIILTGTSTINETCRGLIKLHLPEKLVTLLLLTYTNIAYMTQEYAKISTAAKLRGFASNKTITSYKTIAYLAAMLLVRSWQRSQRVSKAMRLRGFSGKYPLLESSFALPYSKHGEIFFAGIAFTAVMLLLADLFI